MKKVIAIVIALAVAACAAFAGVQYGLPVLSMKKTAEALASAYDGHYDLKLYEMTDGKADADRSYSFSLDRTGDIFGGTIPIPVSTDEDTGLTSCLEGEGYFELGSMELLVDVGSVVENSLPDSLISLAETFGLLSKIEGYYVSLAQASTLLETLCGSNDITQIENLLEQAKTMDSVIGNSSFSILFSNKALEGTGLLAYGYQYYKASNDSINGTIYFGCPKKYDESHLEMMVYVDFSDEETSDYAAVISAEKAETSVSMPTTLFSDDQVQEAVDTIRKVKTLLGQ